MGVHSRDGNGRYRDAVVMGYKEARVLAVVCFLASRTTRMDARAGYLVRAPISLAVLLPKWCVEGVTACVDARVGYLV